MSVMFPSTFPTDSQIFCDLASICPCPFLGNPKKILGIIRTSKKSQEIIAGRWVLLLYAL